MSQPRAVIFDIGNVLVGWQPERFYDSVIGPERRATMFAEVDLHGMNERVDAGAVWRDEVYALAGEYPAWADEIRLWHDRWIEMASPLIDHSIHLQRTLRAKGIPVFALTNFGRETFAYARTRLSFLDDFDERYISGHLGVIKPDPQIYEMVEDDCGLPPEALFFTDDRTENIAAAASRGWRTHHFTGPEGLARRLVSEGLLTESEALP